MTGLLLFLLSTAEAQETRNLQASYQLSIQSTTLPITIDGELDESVWETAEVATDFWMSFPVDDRRVAKEIQTEVRMTYDENNIYVAAKCYGGGPYIIQSLKRDNMEFWNGDAFAVVFDPVNEKTSGVYFGTNPASVQTDALVSGQTGRRGNTSGSSGINNAWDNKWYCKSKSYTDHWTVEMAIPFKTLRYGEKDRWGINFVRSDTRTNSYHTWSPVPVQFRGVDLGYTGALKWDQAPAIAKGNVAVIPYALASTFKDHELELPGENEVRVGADAKIAVTSSLNLDLTINPDFSQVEVDEQVTNLTTVNIRFPEKRLFFLENNDVFEDFGIPPMRPFFSRRIGLDEDGNTIPILMGARLSGNLNKDLRIGAMTMQTKDQPELPGENYSSLTFQQRIFGRSVVKGFFHNRQQFHDGEFVADDYNRVTALEFDYRSIDGKWRTFAGYGKSFTNDVEGDNYFYNVASGYDGRHISAYSNLAGVGNNYIADMGFIPRSYHYDAVRDTSYRIGFHHWFTRLAYTFYPAKHPKVNTHEIGFRNILDMTKGVQLINNQFELNYSIRWQNTSTLMVMLTNQKSHLFYPFAFTEIPLPIDDYSYTFGGFEFQSDQRSMLSYLLGVEAGEFYNGKRTQFSSTLKLRIQPWGNFGLTFVQNELRLPEPFGHESLTLLGPKVELNFSTDLSWTTFIQYNTQDDNFNINSRFQWRFQPLSEIFLVYTDNYAVELWGPKNRALVLKMNYWLNV
ncbi:MAG: carbohydrate binding family 9 domain-containing protein [Saprospiraceae bacterium]|nr:carbohydrate binding family 9 domain-containing protein [Saprospiraceae bacterium]